MIELKDKKQLNYLLDEKSTLVLDFSAQWCGPCKQLGKLIKEELSEKHPDITFVKIDVDKHEDLSTKYDIRLMPTTIFIKKGRTVRTISGFKKDEIEKTLKSLSE